MLRKEGRRCKLWWSEKRGGVGGVGVMVKEACENVVEVRKVSEEKFVLFFEEDVLRQICVYAMQSERDCKKESSYDGLKDECGIHSVDDLVVCLGNTKGHVDRQRSEKFW